MKGDHEMLNVNWNEIPDSLLVTASQTITIPSDEDGPKVVAAAIEVHDELVRRGYHDRAERLFYRINALASITGHDETYQAWMHRRNVK